MPLEKLADKNFKLFEFCKKMMHLSLSCDVSSTLSALKPPSLKKSKKCQCQLGLNFFFLFPFFVAFIIPFNCVYIFGSVICLSPLFFI